MGIVRQVFEEMKLQGLSDEEARSRFYLVDQQGLLFEDTEGMTPQQKPYARKRSEFPAGASLDNLEDVVKAIHPTIWWELPRSRGLYPGNRPGNGGPYSPAHYLPPEQSGGSGGSQCG